jgi:hypothetical protein
MVEELRITNKRIINFYDKYKFINFEENNLRLIDIYENALNSVNADFNIANDVIEKIDKQEHQLNKIYKLLNDTNDNINDKINTEMSNHTTEIRKIIEKNEDYTILKNEHTIFETLDKSNSVLLNNLRQHFDEYIPSNQTEHQTQQYNILKNEFNKIVVSIQEEHDKLVNKLIVNDSSSINMIKNKVDTINEQQCLEKYIDDLSKIVQNIFPTISNNIHETENRLSNILNSQHDKISEYSTTQTTIFNDLNEFLNKYKKSSNKGTYGENRLCKILNSIFPSAIIENRTAQTSSGDFRLSRSGYDDILIETKNYDGNIPLSEVEKFERDCNKNNSNGLFLSQNIDSGISTKDNFQIDINNGKILIYLHSVEYNPIYIRTAIDAIDKLSILYKKHGQNNGDIIIDEKQLNIINDEYKNFITNRQIVIDTVREFETKIMQQLGVLQFPNVRQILCRIDTSTSDNVCKICGTYSSIKLSAMSAHKRHCKKKHNII